MRFRMILVAALLHALLGISAAAQGGDIALVTDGASSHVIVLDAESSPSEQTAAQELQTYIRECTGAELAIVPAPPADETPTIIVGCGDAAKTLGVDPSAEELGEQGCAIRTVAPHIVIAGTPQAGTLNGAREFLEDYLGVRWFAPGVTRTPQAKTLTVPQIDRLYVPAFLVRDTSYSWPGGDEAFRPRTGENMGSGDPMAPQGYGYKHDGRCHSYFRFISPEEFFETHPEYFSEIGGVRRSKETQLCLTNPDVLEIVTERMLARMGEAPEFQQHNFSQMDYYNYCECEHCEAINKQYGTYGGTQYWFLNQLAERTAKVYPNKLIGTLAYMYTEEPPKDMKMHPNIAVWLCHMYPSCDSHPIETCAYNADYKRRALAWSKLTDHLYIWHYITDFAHYYNPFPNFRAMAADMRFYRDIGAEGIYLQGKSGPGGEFSLLRPYYGMQLLRDPDQDPDTILKEFVQGYYGAAAEPIWQYITMLHDKVEDEDIHMHLYTNPGQGYLTDDVIARAQALFDEAETAVKDDPELTTRVKVARLPVFYARVFPRNGYTINNGILKFQGEAPLPAEIQGAIALFKEQGFDVLRELGNPPEQLMELGMMRFVPIPVSRVENDKIAADVVPVFGGRVLRIIDKASGECVTAHNTVRNLYFPFAGGEETRIGGWVLYDVGGFMEQYALDEQTGSRVVVSAKTYNGYGLKRVIEVAPDAPEVTITATVTNTGDKPRSDLIHSHIEFDLGTLEETRIRFTNEAGEEVERTMAPIIAELREGEHYFREQTPAGSWTFTGTKGLDVTQIFDPEEVEFTWAYSYPDYLGELEAELWSKEFTLQPGESASLSHTIRVTPAQK